MESNEPFGVAALTMVVELLHELRKADRIKHEAGHNVMLAARSVLLQARFQPNAQESPAYKQVEGSIARWIATRPPR